MPRDSDKLSTKGECCCICMIEFADEDGEDAKEPIVHLHKCIGHYFHRSCIIASMQHTTRCPMCLFYYGVCVGGGDVSFHRTVAEGILFFCYSGVEIGAQPEGTMDVSVSKSARLSGYSCGTITINYHFPSGRQGPRHPSPGSRYEGTSRTAYLPDNAEGRKVLALLEKGFKRRQLFTIGTSVTTGRANCVIWGGIHHKTNTSGGPTRFGYVSDERASCFGVFVTLFTH